MEEEEQEEEQEEEISPQPVHDALQIEKNAEIAFGLEEEEEMALSTTFDPRMALISYDNSTFKTKEYLLLSC